MENIYIGNALSIVLFRQIVEIDIFTLLLLMRTHQANFCEPTVPILEHLFDNVISISQKLDELGFTYYNGKVAVLEENEEETHV